MTSTRSSRRRFRLRAKGGRPRHERALVLSIDRKGQPADRVAADGRDPEVPALRRDEVARADRHGLCRRPEARARSEAVWKEASTGEPAHRDLVLALSVRWRIIERDPDGAGSSRQRRLCGSAGIPRGDRDEELVLVTAGAAEALVEPVQRGPHRSVEAAVTALGSSTYGSSAGTSSTTTRPRTGESAASSTSRSRARPRPIPRGERFDHRRQPRLVDLVVGVAEEDHAFGRGGNPGVAGEVDPAPGSWTTWIW